MKRCLHCSRPIPEGQSFCRRWWAELSSEEKVEAGTPSGLVRVVARQALARLDEKAHAPAGLPVMRGKTPRTLTEGWEPRAATERWNGQAVRPG